MRFYSCLFFTSLFFGYKCSGGCNSVKDAAIAEVKKFLNEKSKYYIDVLKKTFKLQDGDIFNRTFELWTDELLRKACIVSSSISDEEREKIESEVSTMAMKNIKTIKLNPKFNCEYVPRITAFVVEYKGTPFMVILDINHEAIKNVIDFTQKLNELGGMLPN